MSAIPPPVQHVLELFSNDLAQVRFGDVDAQTLSKATAAVEAAAAEVATLETAFADARAKLQENQDALLQQVHRALAYARVYAESDAELSARLEAIALPRSPKRAPRAGGPESSSTSLAPAPQAERRPRGRPRKTPSPANEPLLESFAASAE